MDKTKINYGNATYIETVLLQETIKAIVKKELRFSQAWVTPKPKIKQFEIYRSIDIDDDVINYLQFDVHLENVTYSVQFDNCDKRNFKIFNKILKNGEDQGSLKFKVKFLHSTKGMMRSKFSNKAKVYVVATFKHSLIDPFDEYLKELGLNWFTRKLMKLIYTIRHKQ